MGLYITIGVLLAFVISWIVIRLIYVPYPAPHTLYFGGPGSGKTMFLTRLAAKYNRDHKIFSNYMIKLPGVYKLSKKDFGIIEFPPGSILLFDEASLNGYDNRDFKDNFKDNNAMEFVKLIRHFKCVCVWSNQGWDELDKKIRILSSALYLVKKLPLVSIAIRIYVQPSVNKEDHTITDNYRYANLFRLIFDPKCVQLVLRSKYGGLYNSWEHPRYKSPTLQPWLSSPSKPSTMSSSAVGRSAVDKKNTMP